MLTRDYHIYNERAKAQYLIYSILLHFLLFSGIALKKAPYSIPVSKEIKLVIESNELNAQKKEEKQLVSPSDIKESAEIPITSHLSDKNTKVEKEQIKRGDLPIASEISSKNSTANKKTSTKLTKPIDLKSKPSEKPNTEDITKDVLNKISESAISELKPDQSSTKLKSNTTASDQSTDSAEARLNSLAGLAGNPDLVTGIPDGEVTLLNAKADRFAVFVRRVALQVFSALRTSNWYEIGNLSNGFQTEEVTLRAIMDKSGKLIEVQLLESSRTELFDKVLTKSVKKGAWDSNPPQTALASDGNIRFIFKSKAWVRGGPGGRSRQWILLSTGLE